MNVPHLPVLLKFLGGVHFLVPAPPQTCEALYVLKQSTSNHDESCKSPSCVPMSLQEEIREQSSIEGHILGPEGRCLVAGKSDIEWTFWVTEKGYEGSMQCQIGEKTSPILFLSDQKTKPLHPESPVKIYWASEEIERGTFSWMPNDPGIWFYEPLHSCPGNPSPSLQPSRSPLTPTP